MRKRTIGILATTVIISTSSAFAAVTEGSYSLSPLVGGYVFGENQQFNASPVVGVRAGYSFSKAIGVEALYDYVTATDSTYWSINNITMQRFGTQGLYHFLPDNQLVPYLAAGVSGVKFSGSGVNPQTHLSFDYGAGAKYFVTNDIAVRADLRHILYGYNNASYNNVEFMLGATFQFGGVIPAAKVIVPAATSAPVQTASVEPVKAVVACAPAAEPMACPPLTPPVVCAPPTETIKMVFSPVTREDCAPLWAAAAEAKEEHVTVVQKVCSTPADLIVYYGSERVVFEIKFHEEIDTVGNFLKEFPNAHVTINGHTDDTGSKNDNMQLSLVRAGVMRSHIIYKFKIDRSRIVIKGFGATKPVASNKTEEGKAQNRRIEVVFYCE